MAEAPVEPQLSAELELLAIPPMDPLYLSSDLEFLLDDNHDFQLTFDDLDELYFPDVIVPDSSGATPESYVEGYLNSSSPEFDSCCGQTGNSHSPVSSLGSEIAVRPRTSKRRMVHEEADSVKCRKSSLLTVNNSSTSSDNKSNSLSEEEEKRWARLMRNRESAQLSRQRKKHYVEELEDKVRTMHSTISDMNNKIAYFMAENATLRQQLSTGGGGAAGMCPPQPMPIPMYPPMAYPWMPCAPQYMMKTPGSQVPLVPIPRLKPQQQSKPASKSKKGDSKTKKVASVSLLGMLFFVLLFSGLVPILNLRYENIPVGSGFVGDGFYKVHGGKVLRVDSHLNGSNYGRNFDISNRVNCRSSEPSVEKKKLGCKTLVSLSLLPFLASEKAVASHKASEIKNKETGLAIPKNFPPALAIPDAIEHGGKHSREYRNHAERHMALSSGSADALKDHFKSTAADGKMQQWFREGVAGPMLSSGMCTEVFQFDISAPGAIVPASSVTNESSKQRQNTTMHNKGRNRRILHGHPVPLSSSDLNITQQHASRNSGKQNFQGNKTASSMVVSVLIDPREASDGDMDDVIVPKSLSRIFIVVLLDSVKYVTYSCGLPRSGPHLVTA
ncbi:putative cysteine protease inhibitor [Hibiscus syriacus]|uniref:Cysteine protease inhibitor n=1 Tax=Hibiscus syriacus TaxID=106335 RepID=A0A6A2XSF0_HIBSY|nr:putative cysteine protease inhibitor [Hibiscus syriacus]